MRRRRQDSKVFAAASTDNRRCSWLGRKELEKSPRNMWFNQQQTTHLYIYIILKYFEICVIVIYPCMCCTYIYTYRWFNQQPKSKWSKWMNYTHLPKKTIRWLNQKATSQLEKHKLKTKLSMTFVLRLRTLMHVVVWTCDDQRKSRSDVGTATVMLGHADSCHILGSLKCEKCHSIRCTKLVVMLISITI